MPIEVFKKLSEIFSSDYVNETQERSKLATICSTCVSLLIHSARGFYELFMKYVNLFVNFSQLVRAWREMEAPTSPYVGWANFCPFSANFVIFINYFGRQMAVENLWDSSADNSAPIASLAIQTQSMRVTSTCLTLFT